MTKTSIIKKIIFTIVLIALFGAIALGIAKWRNVDLYKLVTSRFNGDVQGDATQESTASFSAFADLSEPEIGKPKSLMIDSVALTVDIEEVGKDADGFMETPKNWKQAGWYSLSTQTAEQGNIIINGHYDDSAGRRAAFWQLKNVNIGDKVTLVDEFNRPFDYEVKNLYYLAIDDPERFKIFNFEKGQQSLTLITCGGVWLPGEGTYNKRLIVMAERLN
jgi:LPXTG-site transpeptidase (sortase) family protein